MVSSDDWIYGFGKLSIRGEDPDKEEEEKEEEEKDEEAKDEEDEEDEDEDEEEDDNGKDACDRYLEEQDYEQRRTKKFHNSRGHEEFFFPDRDVSSDEDQDYPDSDDDDRDKDPDYCDGDEN
ncbi:hypothetical protein BO86DRAFT_456814 [Aspergillus japonicus CBS 114.51]|uniref:Uncharacterized protein n=1 Tax=Aspergillus japonicus CBS 114.51 TaxID=1448312 RepID=A0A8T8WYI4_ASPJA|nr:hypothetical protein BO86DRAFT_456814 [Aspergillus japonicus CBS 114.51]RAH80936.1 hypothetical protein BO86DRAFT_456814 [Aspergillus japonicus CBS 114.51]